MRGVCGKPVGWQAVPHSACAQQWLPLRAALSNARFPLRAPWHSLAHKGRTPRGVLPPGALQRPGATVREQGGRSRDAWGPWSPTSRRGVTLHPLILLCRVGGEAPARAAGRQRPEKGRGRQQDRHAPGAAVLYAGLKHRQACCPVTHCSVRACLCARHCAATVPSLPAAQVRGGDPGRRAEASRQAGRPAGARAGRGRRGDRRVGAPRRSPLPGAGAVAMSLEPTSTCVSTLCFSQRLGVQSGQGDVEGCFTKECSAGHRLHQ